MRPIAQHELRFTAQSFKLDRRTRLGEWRSWGNHRHDHVHIDDIAALFGRALETGEAGALYHGVAGEVPNRWIAEAVARDLGVETRSVTMSEATEIWGEFGGLIMSVSSRVRDAATRAALSWAPRRTDMLSQIGEPRLRALATPKLNEE